MQYLELIGAAIQWIIAPVVAFVWLIYVRQNAHHTDIAVLKSQIDQAAKNHDESRDTVKAIFAKLDSIEASLRAK